MDFTYTQLGHVALLCNDMEEMMRFYLNKLEFRYAFTLYREGAPWLTYLKAPSGQFVELFYRTYDSQNRIGERSFEKFCLEVEDMAATLASLKEKGVEVYKGPVAQGRRMPIPNPDHKPAPCGSLCAFILDPEGNEIELQQFTPDSLQIKA